MKTKIILRKEDLLHYFDGVEGLIVFDSETMGLSIDALVIGFSFWDFKRPPVFAATDNLFSEGMPEEDLFDACKEYFPRFKSVGHNLKYDYGVTKRNGIPDMPIHADTLLMIHLYDPDLLKKLETRVTKDLKHTKPTYEEIIGKKWNKVDWHKDVAEGIITLKNMGEYAGDDAYWTGKLYEYYAAKITEPMWDVMRRIEIPLTFTLRDMNLAGVNIDVDILHGIDDDLEKGIARLIDLIYEEAGAIFNINSGKQKAEILYDKLGIKCTKLTKGGGRSTDSKVLETYAAKGYKIAEYLVEYSKLVKLKSGYSESIPKLIDSDGRLRCSFHADGTRTGRLSASNPNLQNQPNNDDYPIRKSFIPSEGCKLLVADLSQIEPRVMAHLSGDEKMLNIYRNEGDIYLGIAKDLSITRSEAKVVQLAVSYGLGSDNLAAMLKTNKRGAEEIIHNYYKTYKGFARWKENVELLAQRHLSVTNMFGRVRQLPDARNKENRGAYFGSLRKAVNTTIQGSAADMIKISMIKVHQQYMERGMRSKLLLTVHDELVVDSPYNEIGEAYRMLIHCMENSVKLKVPVVAEGKVVDAWADMKSKTIECQLPRYSQTFPYYLI